MFSASTHPVLSYLAHAPLPEAPKRDIANDLSLAACVRRQAQGFGIRKTWGADPGSAAGLEVAESYSLRIS